MPTDCLRGLSNETGVHVGRHDLAVSDSFEAQAKPLWSPETGVFASVYYNQLPTSAQVLSVHANHQFASLWLDVGSRSNMGISLLPREQSARLRLVGWVDAGGLRETALPLALRSPCRIGVGFVLDPIYQFCFEMRLNSTTGVTFKPDTPLVSLGKSGPVLLGLLISQAEERGRMTAVAIWIAGYLRDHTSLKIFT